MDFKTCSMIEVLGSTIFATDNPEFDMHDLSYVSDEQLPQDYISQFKPPSFAIYSKSIIRMWMEYEGIPEGSEEVVALFIDYPCNFTLKGYGQIECTS
jgi:hypothetical protein